MIILFYHVRPHFIVLFYLIKTFKQSLNACKHTLIATNVFNYIAIINFFHLFILYFVCIKNLQYINTMCAVHFCSFVFCLLFTSVIFCDFT